MGKLPLSKKLILTISELAFFCLGIEESILYVLTGSSSLGATGLCSIVVVLILVIYIWISSDFQCIEKKDTGYVVAGLLFDLIVGIGFYLEWIGSWDAQNIAAKLGINTTIMVGIVAAIGIIAAIPFTASLIKTFLSPATNKCSSAANKITGFSDRKIFIIGLIIAGIGICTLIITSFSLDIWVDEAFSLNLIKNSYREMISLTAIDVHPPLYYIILKFFVDGVHLILPNVSSIYLSKLVSVIPYLLLFVLCATTIRKKWGGYVAGITAVALIGMQSLIEYGIEIRMYGWGMFFVSMALLFAYDILCGQKIKSWIGFVFFSLCAAYTHYFALVAVGIIYLAMLIWFLARNRIGLKKWLIAAIVTVVGYLPWFFVFLKQAQTVSGSYWIGEITIETVYEYISDVFGLPFFLLLTIIALFACLRKNKNHQENKNIIISMIAVLVPIGTIIVGLIASFLIRPVFVIRYVVPGLFCLWFGVFLSVNLFVNKNVKKILALMMFIIGVINIGFFASDQYKYAVQSELTVNFLNANENAVYISDSDHVVRTLGYWSDDPFYHWDYEITDLTAAVYPNAQASISSIEELIEILETGDNVYFAEREEGFLEELLEETDNIVAVEIGDYRAEYDVTIYQLMESVE